MAKGERERAAAGPHESSTAPPFTSPIAADGAPADATLSKAAAAGLSPSHAEPVEFPRWLWKTTLALLALLLLLAPDTLVLQVGRHTRLFHYSPRLRGGPGGPSSTPLFLVYGNIPRYWGSHITKSFSVVVYNLTGTHGWKTYYPADGHPGLEGHPSWDQLAWDCIVEHGRVPDVILFLQDFGLFTRPRKGTMLEYDPLTGKGTVFLNWFDDLPTHIPPSTGPILIENDVLLPTVEYVMDERISAVKHKQRAWLAHSATDSFILPLNPTPKEQVLLVGSTHQSTYPARWTVERKRAAGDKRFDQYSHPGQQPGTENGHLRQMAQALHGYLAAITCSSTQNFVVGKTFEIPATGTLLLMTDDIAGPMHALGFVNGTHYLAYNINTIDATVDWVLDPANRGKVDAMRAAGQALVHALHQTWHRTEYVRALADYLYKAKGKPQASWELPRTLPIESDYGPWRKAPRLAG